MQLIPSILLILAGAAQQPAPTPTARPDLAARAEALCQHVAEAQVAVGFAAGILRDGEVWVGGFGETELGSGRRPDGDTLYEIGSITKVFTGLLLADAVERGSVTLEGEVNDHLPEEAHLPVFEEQPIQLWHLATHTSALPRMPGNFDPADPRRPYVDYDLERLFATLPKQRLRRAPGERYEYSNLAAGLLGQVLVRVEERPYEELLIEHLLVPLGLDDTCIELSEEQRSRLAAPYDPDRRPEVEWAFGVLAPAGALRSTVDDLLTFARATLDPPEGTLGEVLRSAQEVRFDPEDGAMRVGLGWHLLPERRAVLHNGRTGGYSASLAVDLDRRCAVVFLNNSPGREVGRLAQQLWALASGEEVGENPIRPVAKLAPEVLARYLGKYRFGLFQDMEITLEEGSLMSQMSFQSAVPVYPASETEWYYRAVEARLVFELDEEGAPTGVTLYQGGLELVAKKVE